MGSWGLKAKDSLVADQIIQLGYPLSRIDLLTSVSGRDFDYSNPRRVTTDLEGVEVSFIDLESLKKNKKTTGRLKFLADVENLEDAD